MTEQKLYFTTESLNTLAALTANNNREWFRANRAEIERHVIAPGRETVIRVGELIRKNRPDIIADPRVDHSIYRLNRDTRFSRDKTPYKDHLGLLWWEGPWERLNSPCFYFHLTAFTWNWSVGCYRFEPQHLHLWREAMGQPEKAKEFLAACKRLTKAGVSYFGQELKRVPAGFSSEHPMADFLRYKGFYTWCVERPADEILGSDAPALLYRHFKDGLKLHGWLMKYIFMPPGH